MKNIKKVLALIMVIVFSIALYSCMDSSDNNNNGNKNNTNNNNQNEEPKKMTAKDLIDTLTEAQGIYAIEADMAGDITAAILTTDISLAFKAIYTDGKALAYYNYNVAGVYDESYYVDGYYYSGGEVTEASLDTELPELPELPDLSELPDYDISSILKIDFDYVLQLQPEFKILGNNEYQITLKDVDLDKVFVDLGITLGIGNFDMVLTMFEGKNMFKKAVINADFYTFGLVKTTVNMIFNVTALNGDVVLTVPDEVTNAINEYKTANP